MPPQDVPNGPVDIAQGPVRSLPDSKPDQKPATVWAWLSTVVEIRNWQWGLGHIIVFVAILIVLFVAWMGMQALFQASTVSRELMESASSLVTTTLQTQNQLVELRGESLRLKSESDQLQELKNSLATIQRSFNPTTTQFYAEGSKITEARRDYLDAIERVAKINPPADEASPWKPHMFAEWIRSAFLRWREAVGTSQKAEGARWFSEYTRRIASFDNQWPEEGRHVLWLRANACNLQWEHEADPKAREELRERALALYKMLPEQASELEHIAMAYNNMAWMMYVNSTKWRARPDEQELKDALELVNKAVNISEHYGQVEEILTPQVVAQTMYDTQISVLDKLSGICAEADRQAYTVLLEQARANFEKRLKPSAR